jgi:hypothetical protein
MGRSFRMLTVEETTTILSLIGEVLDILIRARGEHPMASDNRHHRA